MTNTRPLSPHRVHPRLTAFGLGVVVASWVGSQVLLSPQFVFSQSLAAPLASEEPNAANLDQLTLTAIPPRVGDDQPLLVKPGEKLQIPVKVRNSSNQSVRVDSRAFDFTLSEDGETPIIVTDDVSNRWSLASWLIVSPNSQVLKPNQIGLVNVVVNVPADALPGGHYAMIVHKPVAINADPTDSIAQTQPAAQVNQQVGSLLYVTVDGPINKEAFLRGLHFPQFTEFGPVPFDVTVENSSDVHIKAKLGIEIYNIFGQKVDTIQPDPKNVFPLMSRQFTGQWNRVWGIGPYKARAVMSFGDEGRVAITETSFWLLPYRIVLAGAAGVTLVVILIYLIRRHLSHRQKAARERMKMLEEKVAELESKK